MRWLIYWLWLHPIIINDYRLRAQGKRPDQFHWADRIAIRLGFFTDLPHDLITSNLAQTNGKG